MRQTMRPWRNFRLPRRLGLSAPAFKRIALNAHAELQMLQAALG